MSVTQVLRKAGLTVVSREKIEQLQELSERLYVDSRRTVQVETLTTLRETLRKM